MVSGSSAHLNCIVPCYSFEVFVFVANLVLCMTTEVELKKNISFLVKQISCCENIMANGISLFLLLVSDYRAKIQPTANMYKFIMPYIV